MNQTLCEKVSRFIFFFYLSVPVIADAKEKMKVSEDVIDLGECKILIANQFLTAKMFVDQRLFQLH